MMVVDRYHATVEEVAVGGHDLPLGFIFIIKQRGKMDGLDDVGGVLGITCASFNYSCFLQVQSLLPRFPPT